MWPGRDFVSGVDGKAPFRAPGAVSVLHTTQLHPRLSLAPGGESPSAFCKQRCGGRRRAPCAASAAYEEGKLDVGLSGPGPVLLPVVPSPLEEQDLEDSVWRFSLAEYSGAPPCLQFHLMLF